jgi:hypothetical protein
MWSILKEQIEMRVMEPFMLNGYLQISGALIFKFQPLFGSVTFLFLVLTDVCKEQSLCKSHSPLKQISFHLTENTEMDH